ncbi:hypothetical protein HMN09_01397400 [Mycena chlorophos]|uniref:Uncharacterized protein n=1 Tax=Mycena chlorophos TaxID=658473 RepID=A0A8H6RY62_MYCCL|nr:hypothetical protein HMN09_01397400 [Mycena chlorophos]
MQHGLDHDDGSGMGPVIYLNFGGTGNNFKSNTLASPRRVPVIETEDKTLDRLIPSPRGYPTLIFPRRKFKLGDYGVLSLGRFQRRGNIFNMLDENESIPCPAAEAVETVDHEAVYVASPGVDGRVEHSGFTLRAEHGAFGAFPLGFQVHEILDEGRLIDYLLERGERLSQLFLEELGHTRLVSVWTNRTDFETNPAICGFERQKLDSDVFIHTPAKYSLVRLGQWSDPPAEDPCCTAFVKGLAVTVASEAMMAQHGHVTTAQASSSVVGTVIVPSSEPYKPAFIINEYLLYHGPRSGGSVKVAVTSPAVWMPIIAEHGRDLPEEELLAQVLSKHDIVYHANGVSLVAKGSPRKHDVSSYYDDLLRFREMLVLLRTAVLLFATLVMSPMLLSVSVEPNAKRIVSKPWRFKIHRVDDIGGHLSGLETKIETFLRRPPDALNHRPTRSASFQPHQHRDRLDNPKTNLLARALQIDECWLSANDGNGNGVKGSSSSKIPGQRRVRCVPLHVPRAPVPLQNNKANHLHVKTHPQTAGLRLPRRKPVR